MNKNKTILIIAGEASGDLHGAGLMKHMLRIDASLQFIGLGGPKMEQLGFRSLAPIDKLAVMGFWEVAKNLLFFVNLKKQILNTITHTQPTKIILIDYPGFNLNIAKNIKKNFNTPIFYYISPQLWAWKEKRIKIIKNYVDQMIVVFPFEKQWYKKRGVNVEYFGHPIMDAKKKYKYHALDYSGAINIALCPGSRIQEIERHMPVFKKLIKEYYHKNNNKINFQLIKAPGIDIKIFSQYLNGLNITITDKPILDVLQKAHVSIVASGTASLESAITTRPLIVVYKMSWISWYITQRFVKIPFACIVNILANKKMIPELLQNHLTVKNLTKYLNVYCEKNIQEDHKIKINNIIKKLGDGNAYHQTAKHILNT